MASKNINGTKEGKCFENLLSAISGEVPSSYQLPEADLSGKVAIVTGANTGIGKETARGLSARGATVILACRNVRKGEAAAKEIGGRALRVKECDLASFASVREFCRQINREEQTIDILVRAECVCCPWLLA